MYRMEKPDMRKGWQNDTAFYHPPVKIENRGYESLSDAS